MEKTILDACCGGGSEKYKKFGGGARLVSFLDQNSLIPLFDGDFGAVLSNPVVFEVNKTVHYGYEATLLQEITKQISKAYLKGKLSPAQEIVGKTAEILYDAFAAIVLVRIYAWHNVWCYKIVLMFYSTCCKLYGNLLSTKL